MTPAGYRPEHIDDLDGWWLPDNSDNPNCHICRGHGTVPTLVDNDDPRVSIHGDGEEVCPACNGSGEA